MKYKPLGQTAFQSRNQLLIEVIHQVLSAFVGNFLRYTDGAAFRIGQAVIFGFAVRVRAASIFAITFVGYRHSWFVTHRS